MNSPLKHHDHDLEENSKFTLVFDGFLDQFMIFSWSPFDTVFGMPRHTFD